jgi:hypothetical protein
MYDDSLFTSANDSNVNDKGFMHMRIIGNGSYGFNRSLLKSCANYQQFRKLASLKEMNNWNAQSQDIKIPKNVIDEANIMFDTVKKNGNVYRKDVKKGVQTACLYYACYINGISKTPSEMAKFATIQDKFHSSGDRTLRSLHDKGIIQLPDKINPIVDYINRYFAMLNIPIEYKDFVLEIIEKADKAKLHVLYDSKNNTKCIGAIYILITRIRELRKRLSREEIEKICLISKTTFVKYFTVLSDYYRKFVPIFVKHRIPMPSKWREDIDEVISECKNPAKKKSNIKKKKSTKKQNNLIIDSDEEIVCEKKRSISRIMMNNLKDNESSDEEEYILTDKFLYVNKKPGSSVKKPTKDIDLLLDKQNNKKELLKKIYKKISIKINTEK